MSGVDADTCRKLARLALHVVMHGARDLLAVDLQAIAAQLLAAADLAEGATLTEEQVREVVRGFYDDIIRHPDTFGGPESKVELIADRVAEGLVALAPACQPTLTADEVRAAVREGCEWERAAPLSMASRDDRIAARVAEKLAGRAVVGLSTEERTALEHLRRYLYGWRHEQVLRALLDRLLAETAQLKPATIDLAPDDASLLVEALDRYARTMSPKRAELPRIARIRAQLDPLASAFDRAAVTATGKSAGELNQALTSEVERHPDVQFDHTETEFQPTESLGNWEPAGKEGAK